MITMWSGCRSKRVSESNKLPSRIFCVRPCLENRSGYALRGGKRRWRYLQWCQHHHRLQTGARPDLANAAIHWLTAMYFRQELFHEDRLLFAADGKEKRRLGKQCDREHHQYESRAT